ncbi:hypothetical protein D1AOALGA4SA_11197 [Olavius algarvensis Delta 1 endosymbiont]|nr:hypothetical protein D1AOALGA4SA_11197 [Olavius algarvensis Delta 1 endosymbiont]
MTALAVKGDVFEAVGDTAALRSAYPDADVTDLDGHSVMPGIIESHRHLLSLGQSLLELNLKGAASSQPSWSRFTGVCRKKRE